METKSYKEMGMVCFNVDANMDLEKKRKITRGLILLVIFFIQSSI